VLGRLCGLASRHAAYLGSHSSWVGVGRKPCRHGQRVGQPRLVVIATQFLGAELSEMRCDKLGIQKPEAAQAQPGDKMHQRYLGGVASDAEHAFPKEHAADRDPIEASDQLIVPTGFHRVSVAQPVQFIKQTLDLRIDPSVIASWRWLGAAGNRTGEVLIHRDGEILRHHGAGEAAGQMKTVERQNAAPLGVQPVKALAAPRLGHWEQTMPICPQHQIRRDLNRTPGHGCIVGTDWRFVKTYLQVRQAGPLIRAIFHRSGRREGMTKYTWEHIHLRSPDPAATAEWYQDKLGAEVVRTPQPDGSTRIDLNLTGQKIFIAKADPGTTGPSPRTPYMGLDHFGLTVENIDVAVAELKSKGVAFTMEPKTIRPGVRIAFLTAPQNVSIELIQRG
jgi:lactoylglutathione lyase